MVSRRDFLKGLGAMALTPFVGKGILGAAKTAAAINPILAPAQGMPTWFPALVNKIRATGKKVREASPGKGDNYMVYTSDNGKYTMEEDIITGNINIYGRGDESQQFDMQYMVSDDVERMSPDGPQFDAEFGVQEKWKTDGPDVEIEGDLNDMRGGYDALEEYATGTAFDPAAVLGKIKDGFSHGGRVNLLEGGVAINVDNEAGGSGNFEKEAAINFSTEIEDIKGLVLSGYLSKAEGEEKFYDARVKYETTLMDAINFKAMLHENSYGRGYDINIAANKDFGGGLSAAGNAYSNNYGKGINVNLDKNLDNGLSLSAYGQLKDDEHRIGGQVNYAFANGGSIISPQGLLPPERGPMHAGIQSLFKQKGTST